MATDPATHNTIFLLGAGFTRAALPDAPMNAQVVSSLIQHSGPASRIAKYQGLYRTNDIEELLTRLDLDIAADSTKRADRLAIDGELGLFFRSCRFTPSALAAAPWLRVFATETLRTNDAIITLNYDCFLEGLLDYCAVWTPNDGYYGVDNLLVEAAPNPNGITIYKIHGSEHFRISKFVDRPEQEAIGYEFNEGIFPVSARNCHFGGGIDSRPYLIAPSFVKLPHRQVAMMMLKVLQSASTARNLAIIGCGLRREDSFLWLLLTRFLMRKDEKQLILVGPGANSIRDRIYEYWAGDLSKHARITLLTKGLESSIAALTTALQAE